MRCRNQGREEVMIRDMKSEEIKEVSQIWLSANLEAHDFIPASYWEGNLDFVREELSLAKVRVYEEEGKILGFLGRNGEEIEGIFVRKECRSRGIGRALLKDPGRGCACMSTRRTGGPGRFTSGKDSGFVQKELMKKLEKKNIACYMKARKVL